MKCGWREAISFSIQYVLQTRGDIQREILGKGPYSLSVSYMHLTVTDNQWTGMDHKEKSIFKNWVLHLENVCNKKSMKENLLQNEWAVLRVLASGSGCSIYF